MTLSEQLIGDQAEAEQAISAAKAADTKQIAAALRGKSSLPKTLTRATAKVGSCSDRGDCRSLRTRVGGDPRRTHAAILSAWATWRTALTEAAATAHQTAKAAAAKAAETVGAAQATYQAVASWTRDEALPGSEPAGALRERDGVLWYAPHTATPNDSDRCDAAPERASVLPVM